VAEREREKQTWRNGIGIESDTKYNKERKPFVFAKLISN
jgi:hypothetical protein